MIEIIVNCENKELILAGDLNCDYLLPNDHKNIKATLRLNALKQLIKQPTRITNCSKTLIDVIYSKNERTIADTIVELSAISDHDIIVEPSAVSDHDTVGINRKLHTQRYKPHKISTRDFSKYDPNALRRDLSTINWNIELSNVDFNTAWNKFRSKLIETVDRYAPTKEKIIRGKPTPWLTIDIKKQMHDRDHFLKRARRTNSEVDCSTYRQLRNAVTYAIRQSKATIVITFCRRAHINLETFGKTLKNFFQPKRTLTIYLQ